MEWAAAGLGFLSRRASRSAGRRLLACSRSRSEPGGDRFIWLGGHPALVLLGVLLGSAALPLVMVSATAPLVQGWFALTGHPAAGDPYFLYAASNAGSLLALLAYPFRDRAEPGLDRPEPALADGFSHSGDSGAGHVPRRAGAGADRGPAPERRPAMPARNRQQRGCRRRPGCGGSSWFSSPRAG